MKSVYSAVRTGSLNKAVCASSLEGSNAWCCLPVRARICRLVWFSNILTSMFVTACPYLSILGIFAKTLKSYYFFFRHIYLYVCPSGNLRETTRLARERFSWYLALEYFSKNCREYSILTLYLLTWKIWWSPNNVSKWQMRFNSAFKGLINVWQLRALYMETNVHVW